MGAPEIEIVELEAPVGAEGEVGDDVVADARTDARKVGGFGLLGSGVADAREAIVKEEEKLDGIVEFFITSEEIENAYGGSSEFDIPDEDLVTVDDPFFVATDGIITTNAIFF